MPLPLPPQVGQPVAGPQGPIQAYNPQNVATQQFQMQGMQQLGQGFGQLISGLRMRDKKQKEEAWQNAMRDMQLLSRGMPIDQQSIVKNLQKAGVKLDLNSPTPQEVEKQRVQEQQATNIQAFQASPLGAGMAQDQAVQALLAPQAGKTPTSASPSQPNAFRRAIGGVGEMLGLKGPQAPNAGAPIYQFLQQLENQGKLSQVVSSGMQQQKIQMMQYMTQAVDDLVKGKTNSPAVMMLEKTGALKGPEGVAGVLRVAEMGGQDTKQASQAIFDHYLGGPQIRAKMMDIYADLLKGNSEMSLKISDQALKLMGEHENLSYGNAFQLATAFNSGDKQLQKVATEFTQGLTTKGAADKKQREFDNKMKTEQGARDERRVGFEGQRVQQGQQQIGLEQQRLRQTERKLELDIQGAKNSAMKELANFDKEAFNTFMKVMMDPDATPEDKQTAATGMADASRRMGTRELTLPDGSKVPYNFTKLKAEDISALGGALWFDQEWRVKPLPAPDNIPGVGQAPEASSLAPFLQMMQILGQQTPGNQFIQMLMNQKPPTQAEKPKVDTSQYNQFKVSVQQPSLEEQIRAFIGRR